MGAHGFRPGGFSQYRFFWSYEVYMSHVYTFLFIVVCSLSQLARDCVYLFMVVSMAVGP